jgi:o-succinylbenzoate---CoA ligase
MTDSPRLRRIPADPKRLPEALAAVWDAGDAAVVLPSDAAPGSLSPALRAALDSDPAASEAPALPADTALVVPTSGSTGAPRSVVLTHAALAASTAASLARLACQPGERWVLALPLQHIAGLQVLARALALGSNPVLVQRAGDPLAIARAVADAEHVALVPTQLVRCLDAGVSLAHLRSVLVGGAAITDALTSRALDAGVPLVRSYGMTEMCGGCVYDGSPLEGVDVATDEDGVIRLRGPMRAAGYLEQPTGVDTGFSPDGWFTTDDLGSIVDGGLVVDGRRDDMIISGGVKVPAIRIEQELLGLPGVRDLAVVGVTDSEWGQRVRVVVVLEGSASKTIADELKSKVHERLAHRVPHTHVPRDITVVAKIERTALGKLSRDERDRLAAVIQ